MSLIVLSSIDQYHRSIEEGYSKAEALEFVNLRSRDNTKERHFRGMMEKMQVFQKHKPWLKLVGKF